MMVTSLQVHDQNTLSCGVYGGEVIVEMITMGENQSS
jgi:hypothetical protein